MVWLAIVISVAVQLHLCHAVPTSNSADFFHQIEKNCIQLCPFQNESESTSANDLWCDASCRLENCVAGCELWKRAIHSSCSESCNATETNVRGMPLYCLLGCNFALSSYVQGIQDLLQIVAPPRILSSSISHSSLTLTWNKHSGLPLASKLTYLLQKRLASSQQEHGDGQWVNIGKTSGLNYTVVDLLPYSKYQFRLGAILVAQGDAIFSPASETVTTLAHGPPSSAPSNVKISVIDSSKISIAWDPPLFPNGPLVSYSLTIEGEGHIAVKEIFARQNPRFFVFTQLNPETEYTVSIRARNGDDEGPPFSQQVRTPSSVQVKDGRDESIPHLFMATTHHIYKQQPHIIYSPELYYSTKQTITDMALLLQGDVYVYVVEDFNTVYELSQPGPLKNLSVSEILNSSQLNNLKIIKLSIDWLFLRFYLLLEDTERRVWHVAKCRRHGKDLTFVVKNLGEKPVHFEVDPYNGFLFWTLQGENKGLYRADLAELLVIDNPEILQNYRIYSHSSLGVFVVDYTNFRLLVVDALNRTILAISMSGSRLNDFRSDAVPEEFSQVSALVYHEDVFHWTTTRNAFQEEYNDIDRKYHQNCYQKPYFGDNENYVTLKINSSLQPIPAPASGVQNLQALFGHDYARIQWNAPVSYAAKGAWRNWFYKIDIENLDSSIALQPMQTSETQYTVHGLKENTTYLIRVKACSKSRCSSSESSPFVGKTLHNRNSSPMIIWAAGEGIWKSSPIGDNLTLLTPKYQFQDLVNESWHVTSLTWLDDLLFLVSNNSRMFVVNTQTREVYAFDNHEVSSVAADYLGKKIYFSSPRRQTIGRLQHNETQTEWLPLFTIAKQLVVESLRGKLFWSTGYSIEGSALHGADREIFWKTDFFSGKQAVGLTVHSELNSLFWIVRGFDGAVLHRANVFDAHSSQVVGQLERTTARGPLHYMSDRLLWLEENDTIAISDIQGRNVSLLRSPEPLGLTYFMVVQNSGLKFSEKYRLDDSINTVNVIPDPVRRESLRITGSQAESFTVSWDPVSNVNYGNVYYELLIKANKHHTTAVTGNSWYSIPRDWRVSPHYPVSVTIRSYTTWGSAVPVNEILFTPSAIPSVPLKPRVFLSFKRNSMDVRMAYKAEFRWQTPATTNGVILGYKIMCWTPTNLSLCNDVTVPGNITEYSLPGLSPNVTYSFTVAAFSNAGTGPATKPVQLNTAHGLPLPQLLIITNDSVQLADMDRIETSSLHNISLSSRVSAPPVAVTYMSVDKKLFWIDEMKEMFVVDTQTNEKRKILHLDGSGKSVAVDWVARSLYWSEDSDTSPSSAIYRIDLDREEKPEKIQVLTSQKQVRIVAVDPFQSELVWMTLNPNGVGTLQRSSFSGNEIRRFFRQESANKRKRETHCNCGGSPDVSRVMAVDRSVPTKPRVFWASAFRGDIWSSDWKGCHCVKEIDAGLFGRAGLPPSVLAVDHQYIYWANSTGGKFYSFRRAAHPPVEDSDKLAAFTASEKNVLAIQGIRDMATIGDHLQPFPDVQCLVLSAGNYSADLVNRTDNSLTLALPVPQRPRDCDSVSQPVIKYKIYYGPSTTGCGTSITHCKHLTSYTPVAVLRHLDPSTDYTIRIQLSNHYTKPDLTDPVGPAVSFSTKAGAPSKPREMQAKPSSPSSIRVTWLPPLSFNGPEITYEVHWSSHGFIAGVRQDSKKLIGQDRIVNGPMKSVEIDNLIPGQTYTIWVRAFSQEGTFTDSDRVTMATYKEPENLELVETNSRFVTIQWKTLDNIISSFELQTSHFGEDSWKRVDSRTHLKPGLYYTVVADGLDVKQKYTFRMILLYEPLNVTYIWPSDARFTFETLGHVPEKPTQPLIKSIRRNVFQVLWDPPSDNGHPIRYYNIQARRTDESTADGDVWFTVADNHTLNHWNVHGLKGRTNYTFRVRAFNDLGWGECSDPSAAVYLEEYTEMAVTDTYMDIVLGISISALAAFCLVMAIFSCHVCRKRQKASKESLSSPRNRHQPSGTVEMSSLPRADLVALRELPRGENFIQQNNALYGVPDNLNDELALLPHIRREEITLTKFLGSGAFGEVFEGLAANLPGSNQQPTRVAIKTLRKGATEPEKTEFLKEAQLMSHFKHQHILRLLGVCLDTDPNFLLLELMEGGDLLSFLRNNRPTSQTPSSLTLQDLVSMCVDVAKGCCYLEELHFVHRDLAARNCLVSNTDPRLRVVKIGDFGLARDIYRNDYYRKEGEGLLPVRWMAPESLVDGVFTSQSDVWSFGVLLWEIMTLGQQPYPARTNLQVLHFVRAGGRLDRPPNCPDTLHNLMQKCWSYQPEERPTFSHCLQELVTLKESLAEESLHYVTSPQCRSVLTTDRESIPFLQSYANGGIVQQMLKNGQRHRITRCASERDPSGRVHVQNRPMMRSNSFAETPSLNYGVRGRYLELLSESTSIDGYEVPNSPMPLHSEC